MSQQMPLHRKIGYAFGDYGCNLYWQSISFFLLFFYTDIVGLPVVTAGLIYMVASIFDGIIDPLAGAAMDRVNTRWGRYRPWLVVGALPLAGSFALLYWRPPLEGGTLVAVLLAVHLLFRICYTLIAVPLASLSARLTSRSSERTTLASLRMLFGASATATIGFATQPLAAALGGGNAATGLFLVAILIGTLATIAFVVSFASTREPPIEHPAPASGARAGYVGNVLRNRAFLTLAAGLLCATISTTALNKSLLYYFKYVVQDEASARYALSSSALIALALAPIWAILGRRIGKRRMWLTAIAMGLTGLSIFLLTRPTSAIGATAFFMWMQVVTIGVQVGYWGTLPDTVEYGQWRGGLRQESFLFGLFMFFQKAGFGLAAALYGLLLSWIGYDASAPMSPATISGIGFVMAGLSAAGLIGSGIATLLSPLRMGVHERIVTELAEAEGKAMRDDGNALPR
ncbi:glycoside-pentoside-hexuronide (GPH):cation symporter [Sphingobium sp. H39-3-25]|uniref:MFS transporter n=1 Tax=Sphingobium arseniciresistens TaxID=3030834 RepID=UPI0023B972E3|nr:glycoside-pentoside-hexuronide (GPH):cation symporter [Sphingobium arseniciresistens]